MERKKSKFFISNIFPKNISKITNNKISKYQTYLLSFLLQHSVRTSYKEQSCLKIKLSFLTANGFVGNLIWEWKIYKKISYQKNF